MRIAARVVGLLFKELKYYQGGSYEQNSMRT